jgi:hypothetical protein
MLHSQLGLFTNEQLSDYTHYELSLFDVGEQLDYVFDRTLSDVERWRELRDKGWDGMTEIERLEWMGEIRTNPSATKGMYSYVDLNRVESAVSLLATRLKKLGHENLDLTVKTDWTYEDDFWYSDMERYLNNISMLRGCGVVKWNTPLVPSISDKFDYEAANKIEKILSDIDEMTSKRVHSRYHVGELIAGEV